MNQLEPIKKLSYRLTLIIATAMFGCLSIGKAIAHDHISVVFQPPPEDEQPEKTEGAASRHLGECAANSFSSQSPGRDGYNLTALVPQRNYGLTTNRHPNFWVYLPETSAKQAILSIKEQGKTPHWQQSVSLSNKAGIAGIKLSEDAPALEVGKQYQWAVILVCGDRPSPNDPVVTAWIERVKQPGGDRASLGLEEASAYAQQGIWYDALNILIAQKPSLTSWNDLWTKYLESGGLEEIANEPIIDSF